MDERPMEDGTAGTRLFLGAVTAVVLLALGSVVAFHGDGDGDGDGGTDTTAERCDLGLNTVAYNAAATLVDGIDHHADHGEAPVDFTVREWAETFTDESLGVPAEAVAASVEGDPGMREMVLTGKINHSIEPDPWVPLTDPAQCDRLADQLRQARSTAARYPTVADAMAAGYEESSQYAPGQGAHFTRMAAIDGTFDPGEPELLMYDGREGDSSIVGMSYYLLAPGGLPSGEGDDVGFSGPNDQWHKHVSLCLDGAGVAVPDSECAAGRATATPDPGGWMTHTWVVPGCESDWGMFSGSNPRLKIIPTPDTPFASGCNSGRAVDDPLRLDGGGLGS